MSKAIVAQITQVIPIPNADKVQVAVVLGENVIVSKDLAVGYVGVFFPVDTQLSEEYCHENNLFRHSHMNKDNTKQGFFEDNRRVKALTLLKIKSCGYFTGLESLNYINEVYPMELGHSFDSVDGKQICCKYLSEATKKAIEKQNRPKQAKATLAVHFEKHQDTAQFKHNVHMIPVGALLSFHSKKHGTSGRQSYTKLSVNLPKWKQFVNKFKPEFFPTTQWGHVCGSRNVVLTTPEKVAFHGSENFRFEVMNQIAPYLEKNMSAYYEIVGSVNGSPIMPRHDIKAMKDKAYTKKYGDSVMYSYGCNEGEYKFHIYRLTYITEEGKNVDFSQKQMEQYCLDRNLPCTLEVAPQEIYDGDVEKLMAKVEALTERPECLTEDYTDPRHISEGIVIRVDHGTMQPKFYKQKSWAFKLCEGLVEAVDPEDAA